MTGVRQSFVFCKEEEFGKGKPSGCSWIAPPPGSYISTTENRATQKINTAGCKTFDTVAYGQLSGSWEWTFTMDYDYIEPFFLVWEGATYDASTSTYTFSKENNMRVPSFTIRRKLLNRIAGGPADEMSVLTGCVLKTLRVSKSAGTSEVGISMSGFYAKDVLDDTPLEHTDYQPYTGQLVEFQCLFVGDVSEENYVANTESLTLSIENSAQAVYSVCTPFATVYSEGLTSNTFSTTAYSNDPYKWKARLMSGGYKDDVLSPMTKGLRPIPEMNIASFTNPLDQVDGGVTDAFITSEKTACFKLTKTVVKGLTWQKGDGSKLQDQINSSECQHIDLVIRNDMGLDANAIWTSANPHAI